MSIRSFVNEFKEVEFSSTKLQYLIQRNLRNNKTRDDVVNLAIEISTCNTEDKFLLELSATKAYTDVIKNFNDYKDQNSHANYNYKDKYFNSNEESIDFLQYAYKKGLK